MKQKNGFIFVETIVVLTVTMVSLLALYNGYILILKTAEQRKYYDNINDVYKLNILKGMVTDSSVSSEGFVVLVPESPSTGQSLCTTKMNSDCVNVMKKLDVEALIITSNDLTKIINTTNTTIKNTLKRYIKTLDSKAYYISIVKANEDKKAYASLEKK